MSAPALQRVLIAGCGYVGTALARLLVQEGHSVTGLRRSAAGLGEGVTTLRADLVGGAGLEQLTEGYDTVFYTTGADGFSEEAYRAAYVTGMQNLLGALVGQPHPPRRLIYTSSTGVYAQDGGELVDETAETRPRKFSGSVLLEGERTALSGPIRAVVVRFAGIYGPGRSRLVDQVRRGEAYTLAGREQCLNLVHRDDCAGVLRHVMNLDDPAPIYNGVDDAPMPRAEVLRWIARRIGAPEPPERPADGTPDPQRGGNRRISNRLLRASGYDFRYPSCLEGYGSMIDEEQQ